MDEKNSTEEKVDDSLLCRSSYYADTGAVQHRGNREIRCGRLDGHVGEHQEFDHNGEMMHGWRTRPPGPRSWSLPVIPDDVTRVSLGGGDHEAERLADYPRIWQVRSNISGRDLGQVDGADLLHTYRTVTELPAERPQ